MTRLEGFDDFERALIQLPKATQRNVLRRVARGALEELAADARAKAPAQSGDLRDSIAVSEQRTRRVKRQGRFDRKTGLEMAMGPSGGAGVLDYASHVEFGTIHTTPQPFIRPAWDSGKDAALDYVKTHLWEEIHNAANRVARKGARLIAKGL